MDFLRQPVGRRMTGYTIESGTVEDGVFVPGRICEPLLAVGDITAIDCIRSCLADGGYREGDGTHARVVREDGEEVERVELTEAYWRSPPIITA